MTNALIPSNLLQPMPEIRVALIYAHTDEQIGRQMRRFFEQVGITVWTEQTDVLPGMTDVNRRAVLGQAHFIVLICSQAAARVEGKYQKYIHWAHDLAQEMPDEGMLIFPIQLDQTPLHRLLENLIPVRAWVSEDWERLARAWRKEYLRRKAANDW